MVRCAGRALILLVEDEPGISTVFGMMLEIEGYRVATASDGAEGLAACARERPDLIITDHMMPRMSGIDMIRAVRAVPGNEDIGVILISAAPPPMSRPEERPDAFLRKPIASDELLDVVHSLLPLPPNGSAA